MGIRGFDFGTTNACRGVSTNRHDGGRGEPARLTQPCQATNHILMSLQCTYFVLMIICSYEWRPSYRPRLPVWGLGCACLRVPLRPLGIVVWLRDPRLAKPEPRSSSVHLPFPLSVVQWTDRQPRREIRDVIGRLERKFSTTVVCEPLTVAWFVGHRAACGPARRRRGKMLLFS